MAGVEVGTGYITIEASARGAVRQIQREFATSMPAAGDKAGKAVGGGMVAAASKFAGPIAAVLAGAGLTKFFSDSVGAASDLSETVNKSTTIFGANADAVEKWASGSARNLGLSKEAALASSASFGDLFRQLGYTSAAAANASQSTVQIAADLGSFSNLDTGDVMDRIAGAFRGEYDAIQKVIPNLTDARVKQVAMEQSGVKVAKNLTEQQKATAVLAIIQKDGARAMGDFAKTSGGLANQQKILTAQTGDLKAKIGAALLPVITRVVTFLNKNMGPAFAFLGRAFAQVKVFLAPVIAAVSQFVTSLASRALPVIRQVVAEFMARWPVIRPLVVGIFKAIGGVISAAMGLIKAVISRVTTVIGFIWRRWGTQIMAVVGTAFKVIGGVIKGALTIIKGVIQFITAAITGNWRGAWEAIKTILKGAAKIILSIIKNLPIVKTFKDMLGKARDAFRSGVTAIGKAWDALKSAAKKPISFIINTVLNDGLIGAFNKIAGFVGAGKIGRISVPGFHAGGWTGPGSKMTPAGVVHADEFVINKGSRRKIEQEYPGFLDTLNGYAGGGLVGGSGRFSPLFAGVLKLAQKLTGNQLAIYQRGYRPATSYSGTSHAGDAVDARVDNKLLRTLRALGVAIWDRTNKGNWVSHMHGVPLPGRGFAGGSGVWQAADYLRGGDGLGGRDDGPKVGLGANVAAFLKAGFNSASDWLKSLLKKPLDKLREIGGSPFAQMAARFPKKIADAMLDKVKGFSGGGFPGAGPAMLAERGPELVTRPGMYNMRGNERVYSAGQTAAMGGGPVIHQHFPTTATPQAAASAAGGRVVLALSGMGI